MSDKTYDFGFTFEDPTETIIQQPAQQIDTGAQDEIMAKLSELSARILGTDATGIVAEHKALLQQEVSSKLREVEDMILPLLYNLKKNPERDYIHWPGETRTKTIDAQIDKITAITRYYDRI
jgi:Zn-dependent M16 (insulinase) family peptidase